MVEEERANRGKTDHIQQPHHRALLRSNSLALHSHRYARSVPVSYLSGQTGTTDNGNWQAAILCISFIFYSGKSLFSQGHRAPLPPARDAFTAFAGWQQKK